MFKILENSTDFENLISENKKVLVDFFARWCGPCKMLSPHLREIGSNSDDILVLKVDVDEFSSLAYKYQVSSIPNLFLFVDGEISKHQVGYMELEDLKKFIM